MRDSRMGRARVWSVGEGSKRVSRSKVLVEVEKVGIEWTGGREGRGIISAYVGEEMVGRVRGERFIY